MSANAARQDSDWDFLIIADHPLDREIITKLKDGLYDIELENDEVVSSIIRSRQEWFSSEYDALPFKKAVEREDVAKRVTSPIYVRRQSPLWIGAVE